MMHIHRVYSNQHLLMANSKFNLAALGSLCERTINSSIPKRPSYTFRGQDNHIPSHITNTPFVASTTKKVYTGTAMLGVATMHKSNAVPVFSEDEAREISRMRR